MTAAQGCNDADAGSTETRNRGRDARTPFSLDSRGEDTFTYVRSLVPNLSSSILGNVINFASCLPPVLVSLCRVVQEDRSLPELLRGEIRRSSLSAAQTVSVSSFVSYLSLENLVLVRIYAVKENFSYRINENNILLADYACRNVNSYDTNEK